MNLPEKGFAPIITVIVIAIIFIAGGAFYLSKNQISPQTNNKTTQTEAKNWKVYENKDFGISFSYPEDKYKPVLGKTFPSPINPKVFTDDLKTVPQITLENNQPQGPNDAGILTVERLENITIDAWLKANAEADKTQTGSYFSVSNNTITDTTFQGYPAKLLIQKTNPETPTELYLVQVNNNVYYISYLSDFPVATEEVFKEYNDNFDKNTKPIIKAILESMKFTTIPTPTLKPTEIKVSPTVVPTKVTTPVSQGQTGPPGAGLTSLSVATEKGTFQASVLMIDLNGARMITDTANDNDCGNDCPVLSLADFVSRNNGFAGVNGSYFCPDSYPECSGKKNSFDFSVYNTRLSRWINQGNLGWNARAIVYFDGSGAHYLQNANSFNGGLSAGIVNYPGLLSDGNVQIDDNQSGLSDKQKAKGTKVGIGVSNNKNIMIVIAQNVNMQEFGLVFKSLGAKGALNLDTGGSTALYYNGRYVFGPGRNLPNAIIFAR